MEREHRKLRREESGSDFEPGHRRYSSSNCSDVEAVILSQQLNPSERVRLNVGGTKFETFANTLTKYPNSLLGTMFDERNQHLRRPDANGEYFFDRSPVAFEAILNFYRTGRLRPVATLNQGTLEDELDFWQLPFDIIHDEKRGNKFASVALHALRKKTEPVLEKIKSYIIERIHQSALEGVQSFSIEFKESPAHSIPRPASPTSYSSPPIPRNQDSQGDPDEFYSFLSNFSNRELLLHDLLGENLEVSFNDMTSVMGHSYILSITLWNRYTVDAPKEAETSTTALCKILNELRQGVEVKTGKDAHILTVKPIFN